MEGTDPQTPYRVWRDQRHAFAHLFGCPVREREGEDRRRGHATSQEECDAPNQRTRLAGPRPGFDQQRAPLGMSRLQLARIQRPRARRVVCKVHLRFTVHSA